MKKRLFIAINLPEEIKVKIQNLVGEIQPFFNEESEGVRFLSPENWHITISFLGYQPDEAIGPILESMKETVKNFSSPAVEFEKIILAPPSKPARMIWLVGSQKTSQNLNAIKMKLEDELIKNGVWFERESRAFNTHITLARLSMPLRKYENLPARLRMNEVQAGGQNYENLNINFEGQSLDLMESHLKQTGAEYEALSKLDFLKLS